MDTMYKELVNQSINHYSVTIYHTKCLESAQQPTGTGRQLNTPHEANTKTCLSIVIWQMAALPSCQLSHPTLSSQTHALT